MGKAGDNSARGPISMACRSVTPEVRRRSGGLSLVELLIGIALGLLIAAAAASALTGNLREGRALLLESRLMHDLRTAADLISRGVRRAGYWAAADEGIWTPGVTTVLPNPYAIVVPGTGASDSVTYSYSRDALENDRVDANEQFGFRLRSGSIEMLLGASNWQAMTDAGTLVVTAFSVTPQVQEIALGATCPNDCAAGSLVCPPRTAIRSLSIQISARSVADPNVVRSVRSNVRLRNDLVSGSCAT